MESGLNRKRGASSPPVVQKRRRQNSDVMVANIPSSDEPDRTCSVETLLSVPTNIIFREAPSASTSSSSTQRLKPLLTRSEAMSLLHICQLAHEVDVLVNVSSEALEHQLISRLLRERIEREANHPILRPIVPILDVHGRCVPQAALGYVQAELNRVLHELGVCASSLRQFAEQNWTVSESLLDAFGSSGDNGIASSGQELAKEKRALGEIEEELYSRIERLLGMASTNDKVGSNPGDQSPLNTGSKLVRGQDKDDCNAAFGDAFDHAVDSESGVFLSMGEFCGRLLQQHSEVLNGNNPKSGNSSIAEDHSSVEGAAQPTTSQDEADHSPTMTGEAPHAESTKTNDDDANGKVFREKNMYANGHEQGLCPEQVVGDPRNSEIPGEIESKESQSLPRSAERESAAETLAVLASGK